MSESSTSKDHDLFDAAQAGDWAACCTLGAEKFDFVTEGCEQLEENVRKIIAFTKNRSSLLTKIFLGETGTGKGKFARLLHEMSLPDERFVELNMAGMSSDLVNNELFGHGKGAYTGAEGPKDGLLKLAGKGTVLLDEIGDASLNTQMKLLSAAGNGRKYFPVGSTQELTNEAQVVCATNANLQEAVQLGAIRRDFLSRISGAVYRIPNWSNREETHRIQTVRVLVLKFAKKYRVAEMHIEHEAIQCLFELPIEGNVRGVEDLIERAIFLALDDSKPHIQRKHVLEAYNFGFSFDSESSSVLPAEQESSLRSRPSNLSANAGEPISLKTSEKELIVMTLRHFSLHITHSAKSLGINRGTLYRKMGAYFGTTDPKEIVGL